jgi:hypothetical protein
MEMLRKRGKAIKDEKFDKIEEIEKDINSYLSEKANVKP